MPSQTSIRIGEHDIPVLTATTVVVGTGSAGYCAAERLIQYGHQDVLVVTDRISTGSSRNAGSDKQTYYKLTLGGAGDDSVAQMAATLFEGGAMDGDHALVEAALSTQAFLHLVDLGVDFPRNRFGEFVGYKTDHDPRQRATSVGPYTSRTMVEHLEAQVQRNGTHIVENLRVIDLLVDAGEVVGLLCLRRQITQAQVEAGESRFLLIRARSIVYATGGPAGMYARSVFPHGQWGATGAALRAGAWGKNLTEWQFGLSSLAPRWNVSGTYMQVIPTLISTDADGADEREFLTEVLDDYGDQLSRIFLKGYQWPFDIRKARSGSSLIDLLVYRETHLRGRRVFLDFTRNPWGRELDLSALIPEARRYLNQAGATSGTPVERLLTMNRPAYELYRDKNPSIDLAREPVEIDVCAQHNNGGLAVDAWWQSTSLAGLFPIGEAAGAHGVYRPGGAALNSTQVGATRAAQWIARHRGDAPVSMEHFAAVAAPVVQAAQTLLAVAGERAEQGGVDTTADLMRSVPEAMSECAGLVRSRESVERAYVQVAHLLATWTDTVAAHLDSRRSVDRVFLLRDILTSQYAYLFAMGDYLDHGGHSRGSVLYSDACGQAPCQGLPEAMRYVLDDGALDTQIQEVGLVCGDDGSIRARSRWRQRRPLPDTSDDFFETVWRQFRDDGGVR